MDLSISSLSVFLSCASTTPGMPACFFISFECLKYAIVLFLSYFATGGSLALLDESFFDQTPPFPQKESL